MQKNTPLSNFDNKIIESIGSDKQIIFHCQSGNRTRTNENRFICLPCEEVLILRDGISGWKKHGCATAKNNKAPLPLMRQVQIIAGTFIILGVILSIAVNKDFVYLSAFVGVGLLFAGITGFCGMANLLMLLPYNKNNGCSNSLT